MNDINWEPYVLSPLASLWLSAVATAVQDRHHTDADRGEAWPPFTLQHFNGPPYWLFSPSTITKMKLLKRKNVVFVTFVPAAQSTQVEGTPLNTAEILLKKRRRDGNRRRGFPSSDLPYHRFYEVLSPCVAAPVGQPTQPSITPCARKPWVWS